METHFFDECLSFCNIWQNSPQKISENDNAWHFIAYHWITVPFAGYRLSCTCRMYLLKKLCHIFKKSCINPLKTKSCCAFFFQVAFLPIALEVPRALHVYLVKTKKLKNRNQWFGRNRNWFISQKVLKSISPKLCKSISLFPKSISLFPTNCVNL